MANYKATRKKLHALKLHHEEASEKKTKKQKNNNKRF